MRENETNVAPEGTSPEPAKTAENASAGGARASSPGAPVAGADETNVSIIAVVRGYLAEHPIEEWLEPKLEALKAEILAKVAELVAKSPEAPVSIESPIQPRIEPAGRTGPTRGVMLEDQAHELAVGDPVKVWADPDQRTFRLGTVAAVHDGSAAYDVTLDDDAVAKVPAGGLEFDDRR